MSSALDPLALLATSVHAQPGVYALLLGSGVSTGAGMPTGWGVVQSLVTRLATATHHDDPDAVTAAADDPEAWWAQHGDGRPLGYSDLLQALGSTAAARHALLAQFFEPTAEDLDSGLKSPSAAHRAIAALVKRGYIRVILTTNFDRLLEKALDDAGLPPQVLSRAEAVAGITPLPHAPITIIKLHGDYADLDKRNTLEELSTYPAEWDALLDRVLDEYGLLISGWSADWDKALVQALERISARRYPLYWDLRSSRGEVASRLLAQHRGVTVAAASADALFTGLLERVDALEKLAEPPLSTAMAVARVKRYLPDPTRRIDLYDLVTTAAERPFQAARNGTSAPLLAEQGQRLQDIYAGYLHTTEPLLSQLTTGVFHDRGRQHTDLWLNALQRLLSARTAPTGTFNENVDIARHYPALLAMRAMGIVAMRQHDDAVLLQLLTQPTWRDPFGRRERQPAHLVLREYSVAPSDSVNAMPRWQGQKWLYPPSHLLRADLREALRPLLDDDEDYSAAHDGYEYRLAILAHSIPSRFDRSNAHPGEFLGDGRRTLEGGLQAEAEFRAEAQQADDDWPWWPIMGGRDNHEAYLDSLAEALGTMTRWG